MNELPKSIPMNNNYYYCYFYVMIVGVLLRG